MGLCGSREVVRCVESSCCREGSGASRPTRARCPCHEVEPVVTGAPGVELLVLWRSGRVDGAMNGTLRVLGRRYSNVKEHTYSSLPPDCARPIRSAQRHLRRLRVVMENDERKSRFCCRC